MKGMLFTALLELIEAEFGSDVLDSVLDDVKPASGGIYTSVGTYSHKDMFKMVAKLSEIKGLPVPALLTAMSIPPSSLVAASIIAST